MITDGLLWVSHQSLAKGLNMFLFKTGALSNLTRLKYSHFTADKNIISSHKDWGILTVEYFRKVGYSSGKLSKFSSTNSKWRDCIQCCFGAV